MMFVLQVEMVPGRFERSRNQSPRAATPSPKLGTKMKNKNIDNMLNKIALPFDPILAFDLIVILTHAVTTTLSLTLPLTPNTTLT